MNKIEALRAMKVKLEDPNTKYKYVERFNCQAGILAQVINGMNSTEIEYFALDCGFTSAFWGRHDDDIPFSNVPICSSTGFPMSDIFKSLHDTGFTIQDIWSLENHSDKQILEKMGSCYLGCDGRDNAISYITAWIEILEEEAGIKKEIEPEKVYIMVNTDSKVKELVSKESLHTEQILN